MLKFKILYTTIVRGYMRDLDSDIFYTENVEINFVKAFLFCFLDVFRTLIILFITFYFFVFFFQKQNT